MNARTQAIARENASIEASQARAIAARQSEEGRPRNALEAMAARLDVDAAGLKRTLTNTAFRGASDEEFIALVIVSNTYNLNPLLREIYAFPKKGGGIQPIVGYDGWVKIMNSHPEFDGIEFHHIEDASGNLKAVEGVIFRKDRTRPVKKMIYLKEFKRNTEPWNNSPNHMLDVRCLCHTVRLAFGVSAGIEGEDDRTIDGGNLTAQSLPTRQTLAEELGDEIPDFDKQTGEVIDQPRGMTDVSEEEARALDAQAPGNDGTLADDNQTAAEGPADEDRGEDHVEDEKPAWWSKVQWIRDTTAAAKNKQQLKDADDEFNRIRAGLPDEIVSELDKLIFDRRRELTKTAGEEG